MKKMFKLLAVMGALALFATLAFGTMTALADGEAASSGFTLPKVLKRPSADTPDTMLPELDNPLFEVTDDGVVPVQPDEDDGVSGEDAEAPEIDTMLPELDHPLFEVTDDGVVPVQPDEDDGDEGAEVPEIDTMLPEIDAPQFEVTDDGVVPAQPKEDEEQTAVYYYEYERDEDGNLVFDESGNPIPIVPEGIDIPVEWLRDENGELVLDENGNPIATQFIPWTAQKVETIEDLLDPNRSIDIYADWGGGELHFGDESVLIAVLHGYGNAVYTVQWQTSTDNESWVNVEGATDVRYTMTVTEENYLDYWRVAVIITDVVEDQQAQ